MDFFGVYKIFFRKLMLVEIGSPEGEKLSIVMFFGFIYSICLFENWNRQFL